jgi:UDP-GlcNAc:undecaprenyl-phosphate GlcNAc-1-phosphate transferase
MGVEVHLALALIAAFAVSAILIPAMQSPAYRIGLVDHPDHRKRHSGATPLTGGLGIFTGFVAGLLLVDLSWMPYWTLIVGALVLMITGLVDDLVEVRASARLLIQIGVAALMVYGGGVKIQVLGEVFGPTWGPIGMGPFGDLFTITCVVFMINAINMADGLDGLAGGMALIVLLLLALTALLGGGASGLVILPLVLALAVLGFLVHNLRLPGGRHARAFLGDTGSMVLGYAIAWLAVAIGTDPGASVYPITIAWLLIVPGMDTFALFFRRLHLGRSPFSADRSHLHHIIRRCGYRVSTTVHIVHLLVLAAGLFGILAWQYGWPQWMMFVLAAAMILGYQFTLANARRILRWHHRRRRAER